MILLQCHNIHNGELINKLYTYTKLFVCVRIYIHRKLHIITNIRTLEWPECDNFPLVAEKSSVVIDFEK